MSDYLLVAFDLDGTFLNDEKQIPEENRRALDRMKEQGIYAVPCTGRLYQAIPEGIREHPAVRYAITENGAGIFDKKENGLVFSTGITYEEAVPLIQYAKTIPCLYDCYQDSWGWIPRSMYEEVPKFLPPSPVRDMVLKYRTPLEDFETTVRDRGTPMQKFQYFFRTTQLRDQYLPVVQERFPQFEISKSSPLNIEINGSGTNKGITMKILCERLQIPLEKTAAFGDDINDISFLKAAGKGIAMENAVEAVKQIADAVTIRNNEGGFGAGCRDLLGI